MIKRSFISPADFKELPNVSVGLHLELREDDFLEEMEKQLTLFINIFHRLPSHLDGHSHCHLTETNLPKTIRLAKKYDLPMRSRFNEDRLKIKREGIKTPDSFISWHPHRTTFLLEKLKETKGVTELVCHPGHYDKNCNYPYNKERREESDFLKSTNLKKILDKIDLISYADLP